MIINTPFELCNMNVTTTCKGTGVIDFTTSFKLIRVIPELMFREEPKGILSKIQWIILFVKDLPDK